MFPSAPRPLGRGEGVDYRGGGANPLPAGWKSRGVTIFSGGAGETQHCRRSRFNSRLPPPLLPSLHPQRAALCTC